MLTNMDLAKLDAPPSASDQKVRPSATTIAAVKDPMKRLIASDKALEQLRREERRVSELRRVTLVHLADELDTPVSVLADAIGTSPARVRQLLIDTRKELGLPTREQRGGIPKGTKRKAAN